MYSHYSKMAAKNLTGHGNQKTNLELFCSSELTLGIHSELIGLSKGPSPPFPYSLAELVFVTC